MHSFDDSLPGAQLELQVDQSGRKVLDLSKRRHLARIRISRDRAGELLLSPGRSAHMAVPCQPAAAATVKELEEELNESSVARSATKEGYLPLRRLEYNENAVDDIEVAGRNFARVKTNKSKDAAKKIRRFL